MRKRTALVVATPTAVDARTSGASLRLADVVSVLEATGHDVDVTTADEVVRARQSYDVGVAVSYACVQAVRALRARSARTWLDAVDSWLLVNRTGLRGGQLGYGLRAMRDGARLLAAAQPDLLTYISDADRASDHGTVRARRTLVLPGVTPPPRMGAGSGAGRLVLAGDWHYPPNAAGLRWFRRRVLPLLGLPVHVFGVGCPQRLEGEVQVHGHVDDESLLYRPSDVHIAPVAFGGGVKRKVLQPLLLGIPVVTTVAGAHGLRLHPLLDVRSTAGGFARAVRGRWEEAPAGRAPAVAEELFDRDDARAVREWLLAAYS